jgi:hypothetical protein
VIACGDVAERRFDDESEIDVGAIAVVLAATGFGVSANEDSARGKSNDVIKSRPATVVNNVQKYRPKRGCFATGTRDTSGNSQTVC